MQEVGGLLHDGSTSRSRPATFRFYADGTVRLIVESTERSFMVDELVAEGDQEIVAVLAHEVGHVAHRHGLRRAIESSMLALGIVVMTGDLSSTSGFVAALPTLLAEPSFSRDFEREADDYAVVYLETEDIDPRHLADMLQRMEHPGNEAIDVSFLSTHPSTKERIERLGGLSREAQTAD